MSEKKYQVFVSSTYRDLEEERAIIIKTLMDLDCIPAGMETFPAMNEEVFVFIKRIIDLCDYFILVIGNRYGTRAPDGRSYTEKEYDYAVKRKVPVLVFPHEKPGMIPGDKSDKSQEDRDSTEKFRKKASKGKLVKGWSNPDQLAGHVSTSLAATMRKFPAVGWVRANQVANAQVLNELNEVRKQNEDLKKQVEELRAKDSPYGIEDLASLDSLLELHGHYYIGPPNTLAKEKTRSAWTCTTTWGAVFQALGPYLMRSIKKESEVWEMVRNFWLSLSPDNKEGIVMESMEFDDFVKVKVQLLALGLVEVKPGEPEPNASDAKWSMSEKGIRTFIKLRAVRCSEGSGP